MKSVALYTLVAASTVFLGSCTQKPIPAQPTASNQVSPLRSEGYPVIYSLVSRNRTLIVTKGPIAPLYCVKDSDGKILMSPCALDEVAVNDPALYRWMNAAMAATTSIDSR